MKAIGNKVLKVIIKSISSLADIKMNEHYRKMLSSFGVIFGIVFFFAQNVAGQVLIYYANNTNPNDVVLAAYGSFLKPFLLGISLFIFYCIVGAVVFISVGEMFIRFSEYFGIDSRIYRYMAKVKNDSLNNNQPNI